MAAAKAKIAPEDGRVGIGYDEMKDIVKLVKNLDAVAYEGNLYIEQGKLKICSDHGYPVGWLLQAENDEEWTFIPWDDAHDS